MSTLTGLFTDIADSIRAKKGSSDLIHAEDFATEIANLPSGGGGDYSDLGYAIDVEAQTTINKGDKIIAIPNSEYVAPTLGTTQIGSGCIAVSKDNSVAIVYLGTNAGNLTTGSSISVLFRNEESGQFDDSYMITLENYPINTKANSSFVINDDGTLAYVGAYDNVSGAISYNNVLIVLEIDKVNKTAEYLYLQPSFDNLIFGGSDSSKYKVLIDSLQLNGSFVTSTSNNGNSGGAVGNYIICSAIAHARKTADDTFFNSRNSICVFKYDRTTHSIDLEYYSKYGEQPSFVNSALIRGNIVKISDDEILFKIDSYYIKYNTTNKEITYGTATSVTGCFSKNGRYIATISGSNPAIIKVYEVSFSDLTITKIYDKTISPSPAGNKQVAYVSDDGRYVWTNTGTLFDVVDETFYAVSGIGTSNYCLPSGFFDVHDFIGLYTNSTPYVARLFSLTPGTDAEYLVSKYESYTGNDSAGIYGIASEDLVVGQRGEARAINTVQQKVITAGLGHTVVTPDAGYDTLGKVEVINYDNIASLSNVGYDTSNGIKASITSVDLNYNFFTGKTNLSNCFSYFTSLQSMPLVDTSSCTNFGNFFYGCSALTSVADLDTSNGELFSSMFYQCYNLQEVPNIDTSKGTNFFGMFQYCRSLTSMRQLDFSKATNMERCFLNCYSIVDMPVLNLSSCTNMSSTFSQCSRLSDVSLNNVLESLLSATSYTGTKTLKQIGFNSTQATTCTTLSNWQVLADAGWVTGY